MLIQFSVKNFKSVGEEQTLYLQPARRIKGDDYILNTGIIREPEVLPCSAVLGANASGKSTILEALLFLRWLIQNSDERKKDALFPDMRFKLNPAYKDKPTSFSIRFIGNDHYLYNYSLSLFPDHIKMERLTCVKNIKGSKKNVLIQRDETATKLHPLIHPDKSLLRLWKADINKQRTLLAYLSNKGEIKAFDSVMHWFNQLKIISENNDLPHLITSSMVQNKQLDKENILALLTSADMRIENLFITEEKIDIPHNVLSALAEKIANKENETIDVVTQKLIRAKALSINFEHRDINGTPVLFDFDQDESNGTKHFYFLAGPVFLALKDGAVLIVDELDKSLHPFLLRKIIQLFTDKRTNPKGAQLIFTAHDITILDRTLLRPDEIYFTQKDKISLETKLYSLAEFEGMGKNDRGEKLYKEYLNSRYGAVPDIDWNGGL